VVAACNKELLEKSDKNIMKLILGILLVLFSLSCKQEKVSSNNKTGESIESEGTIGYKEAPEQLEQPGKVDDTNLFKAGGSGGIVVEGKTINDAVYKSVYTQFFYKNRFASQLKIHFDGLQGHSYLLLEVQLTKKNGDIIKFVDEYGFSDKSLHTGLTLDEDNNSVQIEFTERSEVFKISLLLKNHEIRFNHINPEFVTIETIDSGTNNLLFIGQFVSKMRIHQFWVDGGNDTFKTDIFIVDKTCKKGFILGHKGNCFVPTRFCGSSSDKVGICSLYIDGEMRSCYHVENESDCSSSFNAHNNYEFCQISKQYMEYENQLITLNYNEFKSKESRINFEPPIKTMEIKSRKCSRDLDTLNKNPEKYL
jgi:hypothetical protein